jgi:hypothetical protein
MGHLQRLGGITPSHSAATLVGDNQATSELWLTMTLDHGCQRSRALIKLDVGVEDMRMRRKVVEPIPH